MPSPLMTLLNSTDGVLSQIDFGARPLSASSTPIETHLWNDRGKTEGAGDAEDVYVLARQLSQFSGDGETDEFTPDTSPSLIYDVTVDGVPVSWSLDLGIVVLSEAPADGAVIKVWYEDEAVAHSIPQVRSLGVLDPDGKGIIDDGDVSYYPVGGSIEVVNEAVGTGTGIETSYPLAHECIVASTLVVKLDGVETTNFVLDWLSGALEFNEAPENGVAITASYRYYRHKKIGSIPSGCGRVLYIRGRAPSETNMAIAEAYLEVHAV